MKDTQTSTEKNNQSQETPLTIIGRVTKPMSFSLNDLQSMDCLDTGTLPMICGSGEPKGKIGNCRGVLLADLINQAEVLITAHNDTKKMYVVTASDDGYKTVFSWQEIFNSANGERIVVILEKDGQPLHQGCGDVDLISANDHLTGPRYVRRLKTIEIIMVE
ncbi:MAG: molybdopterin-dependent oxidoreductase [Desulfobulbus sp.]|nr:molybdopterin-dependent oxidoreductase [Desulfobulbus sp.]